MSTAKCPKCGAEIDYLDACIFEEDWRIVTLADFAGGNPFLDWSKKGVTCTKDQFRCPTCKAVLFEIGGHNENPDEVVKFLNGYGVDAAR